jgi:hypothetical protein
MKRDATIEFLCNECAFDPRLSEADAAVLRSEYRARVDALPIRIQNSPRELELTFDEGRHVVRFTSLLASRGVRDVLDVVKLDFLGLTVLQHFVATDRSKAVTHQVQKSADWLGPLLPVLPHSITIPYTVQQPAAMTTCIEFELPHAEFVLQANPALPANFPVVERFQYASFMKYTDRAFLS